MKLPPGDRAKSPPSPFNIRKGQLGQDGGDVIIYIWEIVGSVLPSPHPFAREEHFYGLSIQSRLKNRVMGAKGVDREIDTSTPLGLKRPGRSPSEGALNSPP